MGLTWLNHQFGGCWPHAKEIRDCLVALPNDERKLVITDPQTGENKVVSLQVKGGKLEVEYEDIPV